MAAALLNSPPPLVLAHALPGGRLHLQHGPIDVVLRVWGAETAVAKAYEVCTRRFASILDELVSELSELRRPISEHPRVTTPVALRMRRACALFDDEFITPMAAVAGAVADELLDVMKAAAPFDRAFVNDGGDIAIHVEPGHELSIGVAMDVGRGLSGALDGSVRLDARAGVGGVATSGAQGRSFSLGIADAVTVLARDAAGADAAATMIANAVNIDCDAVRRAPARSLDPDSDLLDRLVTVSVGELSEIQIKTALMRGVAQARDYRARGLINDAALALKGRVATLAGNCSVIATETNQ